MCAPAIRVASNSPSSTYPLPSAAYVITAQAAQKAGAAGEDGIAWLGGGDARSAEEALAQMTVGLHALGAFGLAGERGALLSL